MRKYRTLGRFRQMWRRHRPSCAVQYCIRRLNVCRAAVESVGRGLFVRIHGDPFSADI